MTRLVLAAAVALIGAATASAALPPNRYWPYRDVGPGARTYTIAQVLPLASVAGGPPTMMVESLRSIVVEWPGSGGPCGNLDRFSTPDPMSPEAGRTDAPGGGRLWIPVAAGTVAVGGLAVLGLWLVRRNRVA